MPVSQQSQYADSDVLSVSESEGVVSEAKEEGRLDCVHLRHGGISTSFTTMQNFSIDVREEVSSVSTLSIKNTRFTVNIKAGCQSGNWCAGNRPVFRLHLTHTDYDLIAAFTIGDPSNVAVLHHFLSGVLCQRQEIYPPHSTPMTHSTANELIVAWGYPNR